MKYLDAVKDAHTIMTTNFAICSEIDANIGVIEDSELESEYECQLEKLKDGSIKLDCPIQQCKTSYFKLKRHLLSHHDLTDEQVSSCLEFARRAAKNKSSKAQEVNDRQPKSTLPTKKVYQNTNHVNRKNNYKKCSICSKLCLNIAQHIKGVHKIGGDDSLYMEYIKNSKVVPKLLTKIEYGKPVELDGSELREAKLKHGEKLANESNTLATLKNLREEMGNLKTKLQEAKNKEEYDISKKLLNEVEARYKTIRYKDTRNYSENVFKWKNEFVKFLAMRDYENPERGARMAVDVMLPFEKETGKPLSFQDLLNSGIVRSMLHSFKLHEGITSTSKIKYLKMFELMVRYLICDCLSPEKKMDETAEDLLIRKIRLDEVLHEIEAVYASLRRKERTWLQLGKEQKVVSSVKMNWIAYSWKLKNFWRMYQTKLPRI